MRAVLTLAVLFFCVGDCRANSSASTSYETHTVTTWGHSESGGSHGEMRRGQQRRANRKASKGCHGSTSYAVAPEAAPIAVAVAAPVYVVPVVRARIWRRPIIVAAPVCATGQCCK